MRWHRGQATLELALVTPLLILMVFGAIYGGLVFMDLTQFSNDARHIARTVAIASDPDALAGTLNGKTVGAGTDLDNYVQPKTKLYRITSKVEFDENHEKVVVTLTPTLVSTDGITKVLVAVGWPPEKPAPIVYQMPLEKDTSSTEN